MPEGSVWYSLGILLPLSKPTIRLLMPNGRTPPLCVYRCCTPATYLVMYSTVTGSSRFRRCDWASIRALSTRMRASALRPAKARHTCVSTRPILDGVMRVSWSFIAERFSQPSTTTSWPLTPTAQVPAGIRSVGGRGAGVGLRRTSLDGFTGVFDLEDVPVRAGRGQWGAVRWGVLATNLKTGTG